MSTAYLGTDPTLPTPVTFCEIFPPDHFPLYFYRLPSAPDLRIGPDDVPGLMLSGHSDVVPVTGQDWSSDPFVLTERDGRLHGRGSADMKGFIACCLETLPRLAAAGLRTPVHLALSYDEETDMGGMRQLAAHLAAAPVRPAACIIGGKSRNSTTRLSGCQEGKAFSAQPAFRPASE